MKKENRNCMAPYPVYQSYQGMTPYPQMPYPQMPYPNVIPFTANANGVTTNTIEQQMNNIEAQINLLDKRVTALENANLSANNYSSSNYQMM